MIKRLLLALLLCGIPPLAFGATASTVTSSGWHNATTWYAVNTVTANAANDIICVDVRGSSFVSVAVTVTGTINVDLDTANDSADTIQESVTDDKTANFGYSELTTAPYYCFDVDSCTTCTLSATVYREGR